MSLNPLYNSLLELHSKNKKKLLVKHKKELINNINLLDLNGRELLYSIIKNHCDKKHDSDNLYNCSITDVDGVCDFEWDIDDLPTVLQNMVFDFVSKNVIHKETVKNKNDMENMMKKKANEK